METVLKVLVLEDAPNDAELEMNVLSRAGIACESRVVATERECQRVGDQRIIVHHQQRRLGLRRWLR